MSAHETETVDWAQQENVMCHDNYFLLFFVVLLPVWVIFYYFIYRKTSEICHDYVRDIGRNWWQHALTASIDAYFCGNA